VLHTVELISNFMASRVGKASKVSQGAHPEFNRLEASAHANRLYNILYDPASRLPNARRHDLLLRFPVDAASPPGGPFGQRTVPRKNIS